MKMRYFFILAIVIANGCTNPEQKSQTNDVNVVDTSSNDNYSEVLKLKEFQSVNKTYNHLGKIYRVINFEIPDTSFEGDLRHWINLSTPNDDLLKLIDRDLLVLEATTTTLVVDYPLGSEFSFELKSTDGFTKGELVQVISNQYQQIYSIEEESASIKTVPPEKRVGVYNRNITNGRFGIWGHDLSDLVLSAIRIHRNNQGKYILSLDIQS